MLKIKKINLTKKDISKEKDVNVFPFKQIILWLFMSVKPGSKI